MKLTKLALALSAFFALSACTHHDAQLQTVQIQSDRTQIVAMNDQKINDGSDGSAPEQPVTSDYSDNVGSGVESSYHESEIPRGTGNSGAASSASPSSDALPSGGSSAGSDYSNSNAANSSAGSSR